MNSFGEIYNLLFSLLRFEFGWGTIDKQLIDSLTDEQISDLLKISKSNDITHLVADALIKAGANKRISDLFLKYQFLATYYVNKIEYELKVLKTVFEDNGIDYLFLKGSVLRKFYPKEWMRTSCDIDVLVRKESIEKIRKLLTEQYSYTFDSESIHDVSLNSPSGVHVEFHFILIQDNELVTVADKYENIWNFAEKSAESNFEYVFSHEMFVFHHIAHAAKHFKNGGCGIKPFLDMEIILNNYFYDSEKLIKILKDSNLFDFYKGFLDLTQVWFEGKEHTQITLSMQEYLIPAGVFGSEENYIISMRTKKNSKIMTLFRKMFIPKKYLECYYPGLKKHPVLLPYYEVKRWFKIFNRNKRNNALSYIKTNNSVSVHRIDQVKKMMKELGI